MSTPRACVELSQRVMDAIARIKKEFNLRYDSEAVVLAIKEAEAITPGLPELDRVKSMTYRQPEDVEKKVSALAEKYSISKRHVVESALHALSLTYSVNHRCKFAPGQEVYFYSKGDEHIFKDWIKYIRLEQDSDKITEEYYLNLSHGPFDTKDLFSTREECEAHYGI